MEQINYFELEWYNRDNLDFFTISNCLNPTEMDLLSETFGNLLPQFSKKDIFLNEISPLPQITTKINEKYFPALFNNSKVKELPSSVYASALNTESSSHLLTYDNQDNQEHKSHTNSSVIT